MYRLLDQYISVWHQIWSLLTGENKSREQFVWSLVVFVKSSFIMAIKTVAQDKWSLMTEVAQGNFTVFA